MTPEEQRQDAEDETKIRSWMNALPTWAVFVIVILLTCFQHGKTLACFGLAALYWTEGKMDIAAIWAIIAVIMLPSKAAKG